MTNLRVRNVLFGVLVFILPMASAAQSRHVREREKELGQKEAERQAEQQAADEEARERHERIQTKQTRKEMKRYRKLSKQYNNNKKPLFSKGMFRKRRR